MGAAPREHSYIPVEQEMHIAPFYYKRRKVLDLANIDHGLLHDNNDDDAFYSMDYSLVNGLGSVSPDGIEECMGNLSLNDKDITADGPESSSDFEFILRSNDRNDDSSKCQLWSDEEILALLPKSHTANGNAKALSKCKDIWCKGLATEECQGYCVHHFCGLFRKGEVNVKEITEKTEHVPPMAFAAPYNNYVPHITKPPSKYDNDSRQDDDYPVHGWTRDMRRGVSRRQGYTAEMKQDPMHLKRSIKACPSPLCTRDVHNGDVCETCSLKCSTPKAVKKAKKASSKWHCANPNCDIPTNTKQGLCQRCYNVMIDANAALVEMPKPIPLPPKRRDPGPREVARMRSEAERTNSRAGYHYDRRGHDNYLGTGEQRDNYGHTYDTRRDHSAGHHLELSPDRPRRTALRDSSPRYDQRFRKQREHQIFEPPPPDAYLRSESPPPASLMNDTTTSEASEDDYSLATYVPSSRPSRCRATGCNNFGNKASKGFCNSCFEKFS